MKRKNSIISSLICLFVILLPLIPSKFSLGGIQFDGDTILGAIFLIYFLKIIFNSECRYRFKRGMNDFFHDYLGIVIFILFFIMMLSTVYAVNKKVAVSESIRFATYMALFFILRNEILSEDEAYNILNMYIFTNMVVSIIGIVCWILRIGEIQRYSYGTAVRIESTLQNSNNYGMFLIVAVFPLLMVMFKERDKKKKIYYAFCAALVFINIILTQSRNAWIAFAIGIIILGLSFSIKYMLIFILGSGWVVFIPRIFDRIEHMGDMNQNASRIKLWGVAVEIIKAHPLLGVGNGNYMSVYDKFKKKYNYIYYQTSSKTHPHNSFLKIQCELGVLGTAAFIALWISVFKKIYLFIKGYKNGFFKNFYSGFFISVICLISMNIFDSFLSAPKCVTYFWLLLGTMEALSRIKKEGTINYTI